MIGLIAELFVDASWQEAGAIETDTTGTPLVSATPSYNGEAIADSYILTFTSVIASTSATVTVAASISNPYNGNSKSVNLNGTTIYTDVIPGVALVFSASGSFTGSWTTTILIGIAHGILNAFPPDSGTPTEGTRARAHNTGADDGNECKARVLQALKSVVITGTVFEIMRTFAPGATPNFSGDQTVPYEVTVSGVLGVGAAKTMDVRIDGVAFDVTNLTDFTESSSDDLNVVDFYRAITGPLEGMEFQLSQDAVNSDEVNVLVFANLFLQIAPDLNGVPGDWGTDDVELTEDGQPDGVISPDGVAYFWVRVLVPDGANSESNPYICDVCLQGSALEAAGWTD